MVGGISCAAFENDGWTKALFKALHVAPCKLPTARPRLGLSQKSVRQNQGVRAIDRRRLRSPELPDELLDAGPGRLHLVGRRQQSQIVFHGIEV